MSSITTPFSKPLDTKGPGEIEPSPYPTDYGQATPTPKPKATRTPRPQPSVSPSVSNPTPSPSPRSRQLSGIRIVPNQQYQLGKQGSVGGTGSYRLGSALTANTAAVTGRANGSLTSGMWSYGGAGRGYSGGATGSSFSGLPTDRGFRK